MFDEKQIIQGEIKKFSVYLSEFNSKRRNQKKHYVLHPCSINLNGSTPEDKGLHISLNISKIKICVSPATIELISKIITTMTFQENSQINIKKSPSDYSDLWLAKNFKEENFWFIKVDEGVDALSLNSAISGCIAKEEKCVVDISSIAIIIENGVGIHTIPMLFIESSIEAQISNWSSAIGITSTARVIMSYYNNVLALWEPLIEPVENDASFGPNEYYPWEIIFEMSVERNPDEPEKEEPTTIIKLKSDITLELLVTKKCIEVLHNLGNSFSKAIEHEGLMKTDIVDAPYVLKNETGLEIHLELNGTQFLFHSINFDSNHQSPLVVFEKSASSKPIIEEIEDCLIYQGGKVYLQENLENEEPFSILDSISTGNKTGKEKFITLYIPQVKKRLQLPIHRVDKRYFPIYRETNEEPWGIISEISIEMGSTFITIRGIIQVHNHFTLPIKISKFVRGVQMEIGRVLPNESFNLPLNFIHDIDKNLYFSIAGYQTSTQGISWKESPGISRLVKGLQCFPINNYEPLYVTAIRERADVFFEVSSRYTILSACYIIHLHPPLILRNSLPFDLVVSVAGCSIERDLDWSCAEKSSDENLSSVCKNITAALGEDFLDYGEKLVKPGELLHLPTVKTTGKNVENHMYIIARVRVILNVKTHIYS